ncbi:hypothetical protein CHS0354_032582 [Potamilus streckersoni]|uniref:TLDc domain-containing protein n=1 Tax=Potamilus streckersoni TaxID=2493646 RepID=A0AAE0VZZ1_9BIVA|nr:hypothetical protein CHS0354_032582 [Potamilus streckersoni]
MDGSLTKEDKEQLSEWIGQGPKQFTLLYCMNSHGCDPQVFHEKCDNRGATVTIIYSTSNHVFGGYTSISWQNSAEVRYAYDKSAFLFHLRYKDKKGSETGMFPVQRPEFAIVTYLLSGPQFGQNGELCTFFHVVTKRSGLFNLNARINIGDTYNLPQDSTFQDLITGTYNAFNIEVYSVSDAPKLKPPKSKAWRRSPEWNDEYLHELKMTIKDFMPLPKLHDLHETFKYINILLIGQVGAGKSSFVNTINSIINGYVSFKTLSGSSGTSVTQKYRIHKIRCPETLRELPVHLCDTRGMEGNDDLNIHEIISVLEGTKEEHAQSEPSLPRTTFFHPIQEFFCRLFDVVRTVTAKLPWNERYRIPHYLSLDHHVREIHCVSYVLDITSVEILPERIENNLKQSYRFIAKRGIPQVVLLTKVDRLCPTVCDDLSNVFYSPKVKEKVDLVAERFGIPRTNILPVKNIENEIEVEKDISILALLALRQMLFFARDHFFEKVESQ